MEIEFSKFGFLVSIRMFSLMRVILSEKKRKKGLLWIVSFIISEVHTHSENHVSLPDNTLHAEPLPHTLQTQHASQMISGLI